MRVRRLLRTVVCVFLLAVLYDVTAPLVGIALMFGAGLAEHTPILGWLLRWLFIASWPLWGLLVGFAAHQLTQGGALVGASVGVVNVAIILLRSPSPREGAWVVWAMAASVVLMCTMGSELASRRHARAGAAVGLATDEGR